jgi:hypothetical protein
MRPPIGSLSLLPSLLILVIFAGSLRAERHLVVNGEFIDTQMSESVFDEWSESWRSVLGRPATSQWYVQIDRDADTRLLEAASGLQLSLYFPHDGYLLVSSQV